MESLALFGSGFRGGGDILLNMSDTDLQLLARYTRQNAEDAFADIVRRHLDLVFSAALRQVRSPQLAEEVAQSAFTDLARQADRLAPDTVLTAWLYQVTRRTAIDVVRREARRQAREQVACELNAMNATAADWTHIEPLLDEAMQALEETDRTAVLLRYFDNKSLREVGETLGTNEDAARKRVSRAVERLREFFAKRGVTIGASGLVVAISANAVQAAPVGLAATISAAAALAGTTLATTATVTKAIAMTTMQRALVTTTIIAAVGTGIYEARQASRLRTENAALREQTHQLAELDRLRADNQRLVGQSKMELAQPQAEHEELLRLRARVTALREVETEIARLKMERNALANRIEEEFALRQRKMAYLGNWGAALKVYARTNNGRLPANLAEAAPSMPFGDLVRSNYGAGGIQDDQFEMASQGTLTNLGDPTRIIVMREREPVRVSNGSWARVYLFADGHTELHFAADGNFTAWEQEHLPPQSYQ
jgi:RNA polymerase sigma factor (sigma-70 family)